MPGPGSGRYTTHVPSDTASRSRFTSRRDRYNARSVTASGPAGDFYGITDTNLTNATVAASLLTVAQSKLKPGIQTGDLDMFNNGVDMNYTGTTSPTGFGPPEGSNDEVGWRKPGDPVNNFVPDPRSPGASGTDAVNVSPVTTAPADAITPEVVKPNYVTTSPNIQQPLAQYQSTPLGSDLKVGKNPVRSGNQNDSGPPGGF